MKLIIVRHGETEYNINGPAMLEKMNDDELKKFMTEMELNDNGKKQAEKIARHLHSEKIDAIYSSSCKRALETAEMINKYHKLKIIQNDLIREKKYGLHTMLSKEDRRKEIEKSSLPREKFRPPGGETYEEVQERAKKFLDEIIKKHKNETVLIVSHARFITEMLLCLSCISRDDENKFEHDNTGYSILEFDEDKNHKIHVINYTGHLEK